MSNVATLIADLAQRHITLWNDGGELRYKCAKGAMTETLKARIKASKTDILAALDDTRKAASRMIPSGEQGPGPLSFGQQRLWFLAQLEQNSTAYNMPAAWKVEGQLDEIALAASLADLLHRHQVLRAVFPAEEGKPVLKITGVYNPLHITDLCDLTPADQQEKQSCEMKRHARAPFDLSCGPLFSVLLIRLGSTQVLQFNIHHIISDGWSMGVLLRDWSNFYTIRKTGSADDMPTELPVQYPDYARWQRSRLTGELLSQQLAYWQEKLDGAGELLSLPWDFPRPPVQEEAGGHITRTLSPELSDGIRRLSRDLNVTVFMTLMAAFKILMYRYSGCRDLTVGTPVANRSHSDTEGLVGLFANTLVLRTILPEDSAFTDTLARVRQTALEAFDHQEIPFEYLVEKLNPSRSLSHTPLFQVMFVLQQDRGDRLSLTGTDLAFLPPDRPTAAFDLTLEVTDTGKAFTCDFEYASALFRSDTISAMASHFKALLEGIVRDPSQSPADLPLMTQADHKDLARWNDTKRSDSKDLTVVDLFEARAKKTPDATALAQGETRLTYRELNRRANRLARHLTAHGIGPDVPVGICAERSLEMVIGLLGILKAGGAYLPLDPEYPPARLDQMVADSDLNIILTQAPLADRLSAFKGRVIFLDQAASDGPDTHPSADKAGPGNLAYVIYTSGTSGRPKGVMIEHRALANYINSAVDVFALSSGDRVLQFASICLDVAAEEIFPVLTCGGQLVLSPGGPVEAGPDFLDRCRRTAVNVMSLPTAYWQQLVGSRTGLQNWPDTLRLVIIGGEAASMAHIRQWQQGPGRKCRLINAYGPTEATVSATFHTLPATSRSIPIGTPLPNTRIFILDHRLEPVPAGIPGELCIAGAGLARGYLNRPGLTADKFIHRTIGNRQERIYRTGDRARRRPDGIIEFLGRMDDQVQVRGFRVEPAEVEAVLAGDPLVNEAVVVAAADGETAMLLAYVTLNTPDTPDDRTEEKLRAGLRERLPAHYLPARITVVDRLPLTPGGKIDRNALPALDRERPADIVPPRTRLQEQIAGIWQKVLNISTVGIHDNFFDLGGHSLLLIQVQTRLQTILDQPLPAVKFFQYPTIHALAQHLSAPIQPHRPGEKQTGTDTDIAVVGMAGRFPGARDIDAFWKNLCEGIESIRFFSDEELLAAGVAPELLSHPDYVKAHGVLDDTDRFDAEFFGFPPSEAARLDPQERLFMETAWTAVEHAGYDVTRMDCPVALFAGAGMGTYLTRQVLTGSSPSGNNTDFQAALTGDKDFMTTRTAYKLNLKGPAVTLHTACSTSLVAVVMAVRSLQAGECGMALAGGVSITLPQTAGYLYQDGMIGSPDGHCRAFDAEAGGTVGGSGVGVVVLKPLNLALADGDTVHAVIKGGAINNDGMDKVGFTAPSVEGQAAVIEAAMAGIDPETVTVLEAHGTGTRLGDPIEMAALTRAFGRHTQKKSFCAVGSVKTNLGHLDTAAGVAGLIKTVLALRHRQIPPSLHFKTPNPEIPFETGPFFVNTHLTPWTADRPRRAGVSSFGIGGTNAHVVLEEAAETKPSPSTMQENEHQTRDLLFCLSARTETALARYRDNLADHFEDLANKNLADVAYTLNTGRKPFACRGFFIGRTARDCADLLRDPESDAFRQQRRRGDTRPVVFMFPGQGAQTPGMGEVLYRTEPVYRDTLDTCARLLSPILGCDIRRIIFGTESYPGTPGQSGLHRTRLAQPALFATEYALAALYKDRGIIPSAMIGHSIGEYVAACLAGVFSIEDALGIVALRGRLMDALPQGAMVSVKLLPADLPTVLENAGNPADLSVAAHNTWDSLVLSGPVPSIEAVEQAFKTLDVPYRRLNTSHAFHSAMTEPVLEAFYTHLSRISLNPPKQPYISNLTGTWITGAQATDPDYWCRHLRQTVRFSDGLTTLLADHPGAALVEMGPGHALAGFARSRDGVAVISALPRGGSSGPSTLLAAFGQLWLAGAAIQWDQFYRDEARRRRPLPTYPFERKRHWLEPATAGSGHDDAGAPVNQPDMTGFYLPVWQRETAPASLETSNARQPRTWLLFADSRGVGTLLAEKLRRQGADVTIVQPGYGFSKTGNEAYTMAPVQESGYNELFEDLARSNRLPDVMVHLWGIGTENNSTLTTSFHSLLFTARSLWRTSPDHKSRIEVVTDQVHSVTGTETLLPEKAAVLGPVRVIPQEYPNLSCRSIDIEPAGTGVDPTLADQLLVQLCTPAAAPVTALRGAFRWVQRFVAEAFPPPVSSSAGLRQNGVYLITGGLGGLGLILAADLAERVRARLILTSRTPFPPASQWPALTAENSDPAPCLDAGTQKAAVERMASELRLDPAWKNAAHSHSASRTMDHLCAVLAHNYLSQYVDTEPGQSYTRIDLFRRLGILTQFEKFFDFMVRILAEDGFVQTADGRIEFLRTPPPGAADSLRADIQARHPDLSGELALLTHCARHYPDALTGSIPAIEVLYPEGNTRLLEETGQAETGQAQTAASDQFCIRLLRKIIRTVVDDNPGRKLKILEVGGGNGGMTGELKTVLNRTNAEYHFTDLGNFFVQNARKAAEKTGDDDWMKFRVLDISKPPEAQGFPDLSSGLNLGLNFDLILGFNVVHAVPDIRKALGHLKSMLAPQGLLGLIETTGQQRWNHMVWGLAEGWWSFEDRDLRPASPLLTTARWKAVLDRAGFEAIQTVAGKPGETDTAAADLILARNPVRSPDRDNAPEKEHTPDKKVSKDLAKKVELLRKIEDSGSRIQILTADVSDVNDMQRVYRQVKGEFGRVNGIIHAAGIEGGGAIQVNAPGMAEREFAPKITGTQVLEKVFLPDRPDFFMLCSSHNSLLGGPGQVGYSAANAFMDAYAQSRATDTCTLTISVNWDRWQGIGMAAKVEATHYEKTGSPLTGGLTAGEGADAFHRILARQTASQVVVSKTPFGESSAALPKHVPNHEPAVETLGYKAPGDAVPDGQNRTNLTTAFAAPELGLEKTMAGVWQEVLGISGIGVNDDFHELGGDSLLATRVVSRLRQLLDVDLSVRDLLERPTIGALADHLTAALVAPDLSETSDDFCQEEEI